MGNEEKKNKMPTKREKVGIRGEEKKRKEMVLRGRSEI